MSGRTPENKLRKPVSPEVVFKGKIAYVGDRLARPEEIVMSREKKIEYPFRVPQAQIIEALANSRVKPH